MTVFVLHQDIKQLQLYHGISLDFCAKLCIFADLAKN